MQFVQQMQNPQQMLMNMGIPQEHLNSPENKQNEIIAFLKRLESYYSQVLADIRPDENINS